jgi:uridine phosphorylase
VSQTDATAKIVAGHANSADRIYNLEERVLETSAKNDLSACKAWERAQGDAVEQNTAVLSALKSMVDVDVGVSDKGAANLENDEGDATLGTNVRHTRRSSTRAWTLWWR